MFDLEKYGIDPADVPTHVCGGCLCRAQEDDVRISAAVPGVDPTIAFNSDYLYDIEVGETVTETLDSFDDVDLFGLTLVAGQTVQINLDAITMEDPYVAVYDANGTFLFSNDDASFGTLNSELILSSDTGGSFFIEASSYYLNDSVSPDIGTYSLTITEFDEPFVAPSEPSPNFVGPLASLDWGAMLSDPHVTVYFGESGYEADDVTSEGFNTYEIGQFEQAFELLSAVSNLTFEIVQTDEEADLRLLLDTNEINGEFGGDLLGYMYPPGEGFSAGIGVFAGDQWDRDQSGDLEVGGFGFVTIVHELLHGLGLAHPHDNGGTSDVWNGVSNDQDTGEFGLNQGVYTTMTYVDGWVDGPAGTGSQSTFGNQYGPMAFDIAILQAMYGANMDTNSGNTTYYLPEDNVDGTGWFSIWDTGGVDTIVHFSETDSTIDLRSATLEGDFGGGGYLSSVEGIAGGFTIANGAEIENATGGRGSDYLIGNDLDNVLSGDDGDDSFETGGGQDTVFGGAGSDFFFEFFNLTDMDRDYFDGGDGFDVLQLAYAAGYNGEGSVEDGFLSTVDVRVNSNGNYAIVSENGDTLITVENVEDIIVWANDTESSFSFDMLADHEDAAGITINLGGASDVYVGGEGDDNINTGTGFDTVDGADGNDFIRGLNGFDELSGGLGQDTLYGNAGNDSLYGGQGEDILVGGIGFDVMFGSDGHDALTGQDGRDDLFGGAGEDVLNGNAGNDYLSGGDDDDVLNGGNASDQMFGDGGNDVLNGGTGADTLFGGMGDDTLNGNSGSDYLEGGQGDDVLRGGIGTDTFVFIGGNDTILDFANNFDTITLYEGEFGIFDFEDFRAYGEAVDGNAVFTFADDASLTINNLTNLNALSDDFTLLALG